jgi:hypothetical protein
MNKVRALRPDEVECRVMTITAKGFQMLLYKDARCDMNVLDETFGVGYWKRWHEVISNSLFCTVSVWNDEIKEWVSKQDVGTESNTEMEKGEASDSFKRACFNWDIGRELYTKIFIWIQGGTKETDRKDKNGKPIYQLADPYNKFRATTMDVDKDRNKITKLVIKDKNNVVVFSWVEDSEETPKPKAKVQKTEPIEGFIEMASKEDINEIVNLVNLTDTETEKLYKYLDIKGISDLTKIKYEVAKDMLQKKLDKQNEKG